ncbi:HAMP domain-containing sensor histidine kinase [Campylobacter sp. RM9328]|uniref:sensor histidine kinase n=1 Tax=Campylobacter sp. RM9328 TaxID=1705720 RepID=UPI001474164A|nr:HAMP domain-containing sensor histidine kinase [Campylobacter sp. RM9328]
MSKNRHILPIFLLYFLTSTAFLAFFGYVFYEREKHFIIDKDSFDMRELRRDLHMKLQFSGELTREDFSEILAFVVNLKTQEIVKDDFRVKPGTPRRYIEANEAISQFVLHDRMRKNEYFVAIKTTGLGEKLLALKMQILFVSLGILAAILLIAYLIIRLSLRPLYEKIEFLDGFLRDTTHEINTPLSVILMSIELFKNNPEKYLANIKTAAMTLSNLYEDLAMIKFNKTDESVQEVNLADMLKERAEYFGASLNAKGISLSLNTDEFTLTTSKFKIRKIIDNLLSNAVKYCNEGGKIELNLSQNSLNISNTGEGIAKQNLPHIFELYTRFDKRNGGFGVGLNLVKKFCDELGFKINCTSDKDKTQFIVKFKA